MQHAAQNARGMQFLPEFNIFKLNKITLKKCTLSSSFFFLHAVCKTILQTARTNILGDFSLGTRIFKEVAFALEK